MDRCLAKNPDDRPVDSSTLLASLGAAVRAPVKTALSRSKLVPAAAVIALAIAAGGWTWHQSNRRLWARGEAMVTIKSPESADRSLAAFRVLQEAERYAPADSQLAAYAETNTHLAAITSSPPGATIEIQDYLSPDSGWYALGVTPLNKIRIPNGYFRWQVSKKNVGSYIVAPNQAGDLRFPLDSALAAPAGMVRVPVSIVVQLYCIRLGWLRPVHALPTLPISTGSRSPTDSTRPSSTVAVTHEAKYWDGKIRSDTDVNCPATARWQLFPRSHRTTGSVNMVGRSFPGRAR